MHPYLLHLRLVHTELNETEVFSLHSKRLIIVLPAEVFRALQQVADREDRGPEQQASHLLKGALADEAPRAMASTPRETDAAA